MQIQYNRAQEQLAAVDRQQTELTRNKARLDVSCPRAYECGSATDALIDTAGFGYDWQTKGTKHAQQNAGTHRGQP